MQNVDKTQPLCLFPTPLQPSMIECKNSLYYKRDDLADYLFEGRIYSKAAQFFKQSMQEKSTDCVLIAGQTDGTFSCALAAAAVKMGMICYCLRSMGGKLSPMWSEWIHLLGVNLVHCEQDEMEGTAKVSMSQLKAQGYHPLLIECGPFHFGTLSAYKDAYNELLEQAQRFDYIFVEARFGVFSGLLSGRTLAQGTERIVGIRFMEDDYTAQTLSVHINRYLEKYDATIDVHEIEMVTSSFQVGDEKLASVRMLAMMDDGVMINSYKTDQAFATMFAYLEEHHIENKRVLFWNIRNQYLSHVGRFRM